MATKIQKNHLERVRQLQKIMKEKAGTFSLKKASASNTLRNGDYKKQSLCLDLSRFNQILSLNREEGWAIVEPRITFGRLCQLTLKKELIPPVVPEFLSITVGGAILGAGIESTSHSCGQVSDHCLEYELLLGNGELITASPTQHADLFYGISGSYGTIAILTAVKIKLHPAKPYMQLTYHWYNTTEKALAHLTQTSTIHSVEGIIFNPQETVIIEAQPTTEISATLRRQNFPWSSWFAQHVQKREAKQETMRTYDYLFRHDRGAFWMGRYILSFTTLFQTLFHWGIPQIKPLPLNPPFFMRLLFGWYFSSKRLFQLWHRVPNSVAEKLFFIHDFYVPVAEAEKFVKKSINLTQIFPIWLCPVKGTHTEQFLSPHFGQSSFINVGLYGSPITENSTSYLSAELEKEILTLGGRKMLYSFTYYDEATFHSAYSLDRYNSLRKKYHADSAFPSLYQKVVRKEERAVN